MVLLHRVPWTRQPQYPLDYSSEFAGNIGPVLLPPLGLITPDGVKVTCSGTHVRVPGIGGVASRFNADYINRAPLEGSNLGVSNGGSLLAVFSTTSSATDGRLASYGTDSGGSGNSAFSIGQNAGSLRVTLGGGSANFIIEFSVGMNDGKLHCAAISLNNFSSSALSQYSVALDGKLLATNADTTATYLGTASTFNYVVAGGWRRGGVEYTSGVGDVYLVCPFYRAPLSAAQLAELTAGSNYWNIFESPSIDIWAPSAGGGSTNLIIADSTHNHSSDAVTLTTEWLLSVADALHAHAADNIMLSTEWLLSVADALHTHAADNVVLDTSNQTPLAIADGLHAHASDSVILTTDAWLAVADALHAHAADVLTIDPASVALIIAEALHAHLADIVVLSLPGATTLTSADIAAIADAIINKLIGARTLGAHLQAISATLVGETSGAGTSHMAFSDGTVTVEADVPLPGVAGDRTNVVISGV